MLRQTTQYIRQFSTKTNYGSNFLFLNSRYICNIKDITRIEIQEKIISQEQFYILKIYFIGKKPFPYVLVGPSFVPITDEEEDYRSVTFSIDEFYYLKKKYERIISHPEFNGIAKWQIIE